MRTLLLALLAACGQGKHHTPAEPSEQPEPAPDPEPTPVPAPTTACDTSLTGDAAPTALAASGAACHAEGRHVEAIAQLRAAVTGDASLARAHYDLARAMAVVHRTEGACDHEVYLDSILGELDKAVKLDAGLRDPMRAEADLAELRPTLRYRVIDGADLTTHDGLAAALTGATFYNPGNGAFGSTRRFTLGADGAVSGARLEIGDEPKWIDATGTWRLDGTTLVLEMFEESKRLEAVPEGRLLTGPQIWDGYQDVPSECEA